MKFGKWLLILLLLLLVGVATVSGQAGHDVTKWHAPMLFHDHGADPADAHPALRNAMNAHWSQEIGSAWQSSAHENEFPGVHAGFTNLNEVDTNCDRSRIGAGESCIDAYFFQVHATGSNAHARTDVHSYRLAALVCNNAGTKCGTIITGGVNDYVWTHSPYKKYFCEESNGQPDPVILPKYQLQQVPYVALATEKLSSGQNRILWNALGPNALTANEVEAQRGYLPNRMSQFVWSEVDAWDYARAGSPACANATQDVRRCPDGADGTPCANNGTSFQVFAIKINNLPSARPFNGWTDRHGKIVAGCTAEGVDCVPLVISANVPPGTPFLNRGVGPTRAPILDYEDGTPMRRPPFTLGN